MNREIFYLNPCDIQRLQETESFNITRFTLLMWVILEQSWSVPLNTLGLCSFLKGQDQLCPAFGTFRNQKKNDPD